MKQDWISGVQWRMRKLILYRGTPLIIIMELASLFGGIYCVTRSFSVFNFALWIVPVLYSFLLFICRQNIQSTRKNLGALVFNIGMFCRYTILPIVMYSTETISRFGKNYSHMNQAVALMCYEMVCVFVALEITAVRNRKKEEQNENIERSISTAHLKDGWIIAAVVLVILLGIGIKAKDLSTGLRVLTSGVISSGNIEVNSSFANIIWQVLCVWLYVHGIMTEKEKYDRDHKKHHTTVVIIYTLFFVLMSFIESIGFSRWYTIISAGAALGCLVHLFPDHKRKFAVLFGIPAALMLLLITAYKNAGYVVGGNSSFLESIQSIFNATNFDSYFAGVVNVNNSIGLKQTGSFSVGTIFLDLLNNMPIINHYIDHSLTTVYQYNGSIGRLFGGTGDQIIPLIGQSIIYFGYFLGPLLSVISVVAFRWADYRFKTCFTYKQYVFAFLAAWFAVEAMMLNMTINVTWMYIRVIPFFLALSMTDVISQKKSISSAIEQERIITR